MHRRALPTLLGGYFWYDFQFLGVYLPSQTVSFFEVRDHILATLLSPVPAPSREWTNEHLYSILPPTPRGTHCYSYFMDEENELQGEKTVCPRERCERTLLSQRPATLHCPEEDTGFQKCVTCSGLSTYYQSGRKGLIREQLGNTHSHRILILKCIFRQYLLNGFLICRCSNCGFLFIEHPFLSTESSCIYLKSPKDTTWLILQKMRQISVD